MSKVVWDLAPDIKKRVSWLVRRRKLHYINPKRIIAFRSFGSQSRAVARIWSLPRIWQKALNVYPHYCLEVISERFDKLSLDRQEKVLLHELAHIPGNFSGALLNHGRMRKI
jgi:predicted metallopeptidase